MITRIKQRIIDARHFATLPEDPRASDLYLVEFPKSGATWLATILANLALLQSGSPARASFYNVNQYVPDIHFARGLVGERCYSHPPFRMIKSHAEYNPYYMHTIYLVRSPVDTLRSYYHFLIEHGTDPGSVNDFLANDELGIDAWRHHVNSWLRADNQGARLHLIKYEDLVADAASEIESLNRNLGLGFGNDIIAQAIELANVERMKASEQTYAERNPRYTLTFIKGERPAFDDAAVDHILQSCKDEMALVGLKG